MGARSSFLLGAALWLASVPVPAAVTFIKFDTQSAGTRIDEQFAAAGVHFVNDYGGPTAPPWRASPTITAAAAAWSAPNVLVNECLMDRIYSSHNVPLVIWFDNPVAGVGMRLGRVRGSAPTGTIALFDGAGAKRAERQVGLADDFSSGTEIWDATQTSRLVVIDYGDTGTPEALDDFSFQTGTGAPAADTTKPLVVITAPLNNVTVATTPAELKGVVYDVSGLIASFKINGVPIPLSPRTGGTGKPTYEFDTWWPLVKGSNPVTALAVDLAGNTGSNSIVIHYGPPATVSLAEFHLTQRGIMRQGAVNIDYPMVAGKFTIVRIQLEAKTAEGYDSYVNQVKLTLQRHDGLNPVPVAEFWGTSYSPYVSTFKSASAMAGIHFWIPGVEVAQAGHYRMVFQAYLGEAPVGPPLEIPAPERMIFFNKTKPLRLFILPTEAPLFAADLGPAFQAQTIRTLQFAKRAFPIADDGLEYVIGAPLPMGDGSAAMDAAQAYIEGTGVEWTFKDAHPTGIWRAQHMVFPDGGRVYPGALINLPRPTKYGLFRPGAPPQWDATQYPIPMDDDHDGNVDNEMANLLAEFYIPTTGVWSTDIAKYAHGMTFRGFRDTNRDHQYNIGANDDFATGEPLAPMVKRWVNVRNKLLFGPALQARNAYNAATGGQWKHAILWYPEPFHPENGEFGMLGNGQGQRPGEEVWIRPSALPPQTPGAEVNNWGEHILAHELGHNYGLFDTYYDNTPADKYVIPAWQAYIYYTAVPPDPAMPFWGIMKESQFPNRLFFTDYEYAMIFFKLWVTGSAKPTPPAAPKETAFHISGAIAPDGTVTVAASGLTPETDFSTEDRSSLYHLRLGAGAIPLADFYFAPNYPAPMDFGQDERAAAAGQPTGGYGRFDLVVPFPEDANRAEIMKGAQVLFRIDRSRGAPTVRVTAPVGGERFDTDDPIAIRWQAADGDADPLVYAIQYSPDNGGRWIPLAGGLTATSFTLGAAGLPGGAQGKIRVRACDGFNTGEGVSGGAFTVSGKPPLAAILQPTSGTTFLQGEHVPLVGEAIDPEGESLAVTWTVAVEGGAITTSSLACLLPALEPGEYLARLEVTDADGFTVAHEAAFTVVADSDRDGMSDNFEGDYLLDAGNPADALADADGDGVANFDEASLGLNPRLEDTDGDGWNDGVEVRAGSDPRDPASVPPANSARGWKSYP